MPGTFLGDGVKEKSAWHFFLRFVYETALVAAGLWYLPYAFLTRRITSSLPQRFGFQPEAARAKLQAPGAIWLHAASVGEVQAARPLIEALRARVNAPWIFSVVTETGYRTARTLARDGDVVVHLPFDLRSCVQRAFGEAKPRLCLVMETEVWPNFWQLWIDKQVPIVVVNGRISNRAWPRYQWAKRWIAPALSRASAVCVQTEEDARRFRALGAPADRVHVTGNLKFDLSIDEARIAQQAEALRRVFGIQPDDQLLVAGSTHPGEEEMVLEAYQRLRCQFPHLRLLVAPRHPQRSSAVATVAKRFGYEAVFRTRGGAGEVLILDTVGELVAAYSLATIVFMGGSLVKHGGQNPIEPALFAKPILTGPYVHNFQAIYDLFSAQEAAQVVSNADELASRCGALLRQVDERDAMGGQAQHLITTSRGAVDRLLELIEGYLVA